MNILSNKIGTDQANQLIAILASKPNLTTLCGFSGDETKLDLSNKNLSAGCAVLVANEVKNNEALVKLDISQNDMFADRVPGVGIKMNQVATDAIINAVAANTVLSTLNISDTLLCGCPSCTRDPAWGEDYSTATLEKLCNMLKHNNVSALWCNW